MAEDPRKARLHALTGGTGSAPDGEMERRVTPRGAISRDRMIDAALQLLAEGGYAAVTTNAVCRRAEVATASLYHHFGDKAGLLVAMIDSSLTYAARRFVELIGDEARPLARLQRYVHAMRELGRDYRANTMGVLSTLAEGAADSPEIRTAIADVRRRAWGFVAAEMADTIGVEDGMLFSHIQFAFATYITEVARSATSKDEVRALYDSFNRTMMIVSAALRPALLDAPEFAAAVEAASEPDPHAHHQGESDAPPDPANA